MFFEAIFFVRPKGHQGPLDEPIVKTFKPIFVNNTWFYSWTAREKIHYKQTEIILSELPAVEQPDIILTGIRLIQL